MPGGGKVEIQGQVDQENLRLLLLLLEHPVPGDHLDSFELDPIGHEAADAGMSERPSGPSARPRIC